MELAEKRSRRELIITLVIWAVLVVLAGTALLLLRGNAIRIINRIHYVDVSRGDKAAVLYAEAEKNARAVLHKAAQLNDDSEQKVTINPSDEQLKKSVALFEEALKIDARPEFSPERTFYYELLGQVYDAAGNRQGQLLSHARSFMSKEDYKNALDYIDEAKQAAPISSEPLLLLAQLHHVNGRTTVAVATLNDLYTSYTVTPKARWVYARLLRQTGKPEQAIEELKKAVEADPRNLSYRTDLGVSLADSGEVAAAVKVLEGGLTDGGWYDGAYLHTYGNYLINTGDLEEAIRVLVQADELAPYSGDVQWSLANAYHKAGKLRQEASALRRAIEVKPELRNQIY